MFDIQISRIKSIAREFTGRSVTTMTGQYFTVGDFGLKILVDPFDIIVKYDADVVGLWKTASLNTFRDHGKALVKDVSLRRERIDIALLFATRAIAFMGTPHVRSDLAS
ncbi:hypothetical protein NA56DRAFT_663841 [Hyaloscypha hepaticicola]|uniref:Uncharacterized protein n=1 Tax=Hyaloscypha hepaticicola TaxID=2082293 RepID=A0A2J6PN13_9HELO|nr:hypothetical protein NA56DRAFT_663841 [Hyaloscypha hepaticicola]